MKVKKPLVQSATAVVNVCPPKPHRFQRLYHVLDALFSIDARTLAVFRIGLGLLILSDLLYRAHDIEAHYSEFGVMPAAILTVYSQSFYYLTIHTMNPSPAVAAGLFVIAGVFALALLLGYQTRLASIVSWFLLISLQNRNPMVAQGEDTILRMMAFWGMFLPLGAVWSLDRALSRTPVTVPPRFLSFGTAGLVLQVCFVYWFTAFFKSGPTWHKDGTAVYLALTYEQFTTPFGRWMATTPHALLTLLTRLTWYLERFGPIFALLGGFFAPLRVLMVFAFVGFHLSLSACLELGLFSYICAGAWIVFLPGWFWDTGAKLLAKVSRKPFRYSPPKYLTPLLDRLRPQPIYTTSHWMTQAVAGFFIVYILCWNIRSLDFQRHVQWFPISANWIGELTHVDQQWDMFAPDVPTAHGWMVVPGVLKDGTQVDLLNEIEQVNWKQPALVSSTYINDRWRKYLMNLCMDQNQIYRFYFAQYLHRRWNQTHSGDKQVRAVSIYFMRQLALPNYRLSEREPVLLGSYQFPDM